MSSIGFYIVISLIFLQIILTFIFYTRSLNPIKKYTLDITDKYIFYLTGLTNEIKINEPVKKKRKSPKVKSNSKYKFEANATCLHKKKYSVN